MSQLQLPIFPEGVTQITSELAFKKQEGRVAYFNGLMPVFVHDENDVATFRMITSQFCINGNAQQVDIVQAFGVTAVSVKRAVKIYRTHGPKGFYAKRPVRGAAVLTAEVMKQAQSLLDEELSIPEVARQLNLKANTLAKAERAGRLHSRVKKK